MTKRATFRGQVSSGSSRHFPLDLTSQGPLFETHVMEGQQLLFKGSAMVVNDQSKDGITKKISSDVYVQERIWDMEKAQVIPFRTVMRRELLNERTNE